MEFNRDDWLSQAAFRTEWKKFIARLESLQLEVESGEFPERHEPLLWDVLRSGTEVVKSYNVMRSYLVALNGAVVIRRTPLGLQYESYVEPATPEMRAFFEDHKKTLLTLMPYHYGTEVG